MEKENINFIPANELPVAEGDEVSVLCIEGGEMKQKPGASLGGTGDVFVVHTIIDDDELFAIEETFEEVVNAIEAGKAVLLRMIGNSGFPCVAMLSNVASDKIYFVGFSGNATDSMQIALYELQSDGHITTSSIYWYT